MYFKEMTHYWHDRNRAVEELLEEVLDHYLEIMSGSMDGDEDMEEDTYEAKEHLFNNQEYYYYTDLYCFYNAIEFWLDTAEEIPDEKRQLADKIAAEIAELIF